MTSGNVAADATATQGDPEAEQSAAPLEAAHRYLMITVAMNESVLEKPEGLLLEKELLDKRKEALDELFVWADPGASQRAGNIHAVVWMTILGGLEGAPGGVEIELAFLHDEAAVGVAEQAQCNAEHVG